LAILQRSKHTTIDRGERPRDEEATLEAVTKVLLCHIPYDLSFIIGNVMEQEFRLRVNENGRVVIPADFRRALGIEIGDEVVMRLQNDELRITTQQRRIQRAQQRARKYVKPGTSLVDELLAERREAARHE
jgi:AbrB family looped-hinge helix DNA binding protein